MSKEIVNRINALLMEKDIKKSKFYKDVGLTSAAFSNWNNGTNAPKLANLKRIADYLDVPLEYIAFGTVEVGKNNSLGISDEAVKIAKDYDELDRYGKQTVQAVLKSETARVKVEQVSKPVRDKVIPLFGNSFAAGPLEPDFGNVWTNYSVPVDSRADFAIHVNGDSMEPYIHDGDIALGVRRNPRDGETGAFMLDGEFLVKQYCSDHRGDVFLFSLNRSRKDADVQLMVEEEHNLVCFGTIILEKLPLPEDY